MKRRTSPHKQSENEQLGGEVLHTVADLLSDPNLIESFRLYLGSEISKITLLKLHGPEEVRPRSRGWDAEPRAGGRDNPLLWREVWLNSRP